VKHRGFRCRPSDRFAWRPPLKKAIRDMGWKPKFPKLEAVVATAWAWHKKHPSDYPD